MYSFRSPGIGAWQRTQREQPRHEPEIGVCLARANELVDLVETGEVVPRLGSTIAERFHRDTRQVNGNVADGNELTAFLRVAFLVHRVSVGGRPLVQAVYRQAMLNDPVDRHVDDGGSGLSEPARHRVHFL